MLARTEDCPTTRLPATLPLLPLSLSAVSILVTEQLAVDSTHYRVSRLETSNNKGSQVKIPIQIQSKPHLQEN